MVVIFQSKIFNFLFLFSYILKVAYTFDVNDEASMRQITVLACAAIAKKLVDVPSENAKFEEASRMFSTRINYELEQTRNFVNLLLLNNCYKKLDMQVASEIIRERAESKDVNEKYLQYLNVDKVYNEYIELENEEKKALFQELAEIKEHLKGLSDNLGDLTKGIGATPSNSKTTANSKIKPGHQKATKEEKEARGFFTLIIDLFKFTIISTLSFIFENIYIIGLATVLAILFSLLGRKRVRKVKKQNNSD